METIGVIGAGQMGAGIAQTIAQHGMRVLLSDVDLAAATRGKAAIDKALARLVGRGKLGADEAEETLARIEPVAELAPMARASFVIEAATENERPSNLTISDAKKIFY